VFEDPATVTEQTSLRKKIDQYWKSGFDSWSRTEEDLSKAPQMYNLTLALAMACKAGGCWKQRVSNRLVENTAYCPKTKIDPQIFMDNLVGDTDKDNKLTETEFLDQYKTLSSLRAVQWVLDPMKCTSSDANECETMCQTSSASSGTSEAVVPSSTCNCNSIQDENGWDPWEGTCLFSNLDDPSCFFSDFLLPPSAFFMHLASHDTKSSELDFVGAQRLFDIGFVTKLFGEEFDRDGSGTIDMYELHCLYLEERPLSPGESRNSCYEDSGGYDAFADYFTAVQL